jgi:hypothetical protein
MSRPKTLVFSQSKRMSTRFRMDTCLVMYTLRQSRKANCPQISMFASISTCIPPHAQWESATAGSALLNVGCKLVSLCHSMQHSMQHTLRSMVAQSTCITARLFPMYAMIPSERNEKDGADSRALLASTVWNGASVFSPPQPRTLLRLIVRAMYAPCCPATCTQGPASSVILQALRIDTQQHTWMYAAAIYLWHGAPRCLCSCAPMHYMAPPCTTIPEQRQSTVLWT